MRYLQFDSVLLFTLVIPFVMTVRLSPGETPYLLFTVIFFLLLYSLVVDLFSPDTDKTPFFPWLKHAENIKDVLLWSVTVLVIGNAFYSAMVVRHRTAPIYDIHDIVLQQESAIRFLLDGKNPYAVTYFGTPLEEWEYSETEINPALYHFVMQPFYLLFSLPFYAFALSTFGFFDGRMPLIALFAVMLITAWLAVKDRMKRRLFVILLAFHPSMLLYTLEGRSDVFMYAFLLLAFYFLQKNRFIVSGVAMAAAFAVKQSAWPIFPLYAGYLWYMKDKGNRGDAAYVGSFGRKFVHVARFLLPFIVTFIIIVLPFVWWDAKAFLESTVLYLSGSIDTSYPVSGYGFGMLLSEWGVIQDRFAYYPFFWWQLLFGLPVLVVSLLFLKKYPTVKTLILSYGIFLFVYWYFSRYFNNSHIAYLSMIFITAYFWEEKNHASG